jgi:hypothetical protein
LNDPEVDDPVARNTDRVEDVCRSVSSMVPVAIDPDDSWLLHLLAIFRGNLLGERDDSRDDQNLSGVNYRREQRDQPDI